MCLIIESKPEHHIPYALMQSFCVQNQDGWGIMFRRSEISEPTVVKGMGLAKLWKAYRDLHSQGLEMYIHLRMATHGDVKESNTHPYHVMDDLWLMHNGIVEAPEYNTARSDTWHFVEYILKPLLEQSTNRYELIRSDSFAWLINEYLGDSNRFVLMDRYGAVTFRHDNWHTMTASDGKNVPVGMRVSNTYAWSHGSQGWKMPFGNHSQFMNWFHSTPPVTVKSAEKSAGILCGMPGKTISSTVALHPYEHDELRRERDYDIASQAWMDGRIDAAEYAEWTAEIRAEAAANTADDERYGSIQAMPLADQLRIVEKMSYQELLGFVYDDPDGAADILHYCVR